MTLHIGDKAPAFTLPDQDENSHSLSDYSGKWVLLYFYPKDSTPGCTKEACAMRDNKSTFEEVNAVVLGVSADAAKSHKSFANKQSLNFALLSDESKEMIKAYDAWGPKKFMGREFLGIKRISYLINPEGEIAKIYQTVKPATHAQEVIEDLKTLQK